MAFTRGCDRRRGKGMRICGWIIRHKVIGGVAIVEVSSNEVRPHVLVLKRDREPELFELARGLDVGTALCFEGEPAEAQVSKRGREYVAKSLEVHARPIEPLPVDTAGKVPALLDTRIRYRWLLLRNPVEKAIARIRASLIDAMRRRLIERGFLEVNTPKIVAAGAEGGATLFRVEYFENAAYLSQSPQLYKQMLVASIPKVFEITPYFRAEKFNTSRHLNESWGVDVEEAFINGVEDVMNTLEDLVYHAISFVADNLRDELEVLGIELRKPARPFRRLKFEEAVDMLRGEGIEVPEGEDLSDAAERKLGELMAEKGYDLYFIVGFPSSATGFYYMREDDGHRTRKFDLDYRGLEIASGGQREHRLDRLLQNMREKGLRAEDFAFYLEAFKYGMPPHGGFGLGLERLTMSMLGLENIREATIFVRDRTRLVP
ncbi:MAG: aspartate--tRNA(Asn) ligase [Desulfurococcaceae archaeon]